MARHALRRLFGSPHRLLLLRMRLLVKVLHHRPPVGLRLLRLLVLLRLLLELLLLKRPLLLRLVACIPSSSSGSCGGCHLSPENLGRRHLSLSGRRRPTRRTLRKTFAPLLLLQLVTLQLVSLKLIALSLLLQLLLLRIPLLLFTELLLALLLLPQLLLDVPGLRRSLLLALLGRGSVRARLLRLLAILDDTLLLFWPWGWIQLLIPVPRLSWLALSPIIAVWGRNLAAHHCGNCTRRLTARLRRTVGLLFDGTSNFLATFHAVLGCTLQLLHADVEETKTLRRFGAPLYIEQLLEIRSRHPSAR